MATAKDIMTDEVATIPGSATVADAVRLMKLKELHSLIVERRTGDDAYGIVTSNDISSKVVAYGKNPKAVKIYEIMTKPCLVVNPDLAIEYVARLFARFDVDRAPVIKGDLLGIVSTTDILFKGDFLENPRVELLEKALEQAVEKARAVGNSAGLQSEEAKAAWQEANAIEAELAFVQDSVPEKPISAS